MKSPDLSRFGTILALSITFCAGHTCLVAQRTPLEGDWAGWAYFHGGGDIPLQFHGAEGGRGSGATLDSPAESRFGIPVEEAYCTAPDSVVIRQSAGLVLRGRQEHDRIRGTLFAGSVTAYFDLVRSAVPLVLGDSATYSGFADLVGIYTNGDQGGVVIAQQWWGEVLYTDLRTGRHGTLFPTERGDFVAGPGIYVPSPIEATVRFDRDPDGVVTEAVWAADGAEVHLPRMQVTQLDTLMDLGDRYLAATLLLPTGSEPSRALVVMGGGSWYERADVLSDAYRLASSRTAVAIFDRRGYGHSSGEPLSTFAEIAEDAARCADLLASRPEVDPERIGVFGKSRSGWIAPIAANRSSAIRFVVLSVPATISPVKQETIRKLNALRDDGADEEKLGLAEAYLDRLYTFAVHGQGWDVLERLKARCDSAGIADHLGGFKEQEGPDQQWWTMNGGYDPVPELQRIRKPVLALFGGSDRNVVPEVNGPIMEASLEGPRAGDRTVLVIPRADHFMWNTEDAGARNHRRKGFVPQYWNSIFEWLGER